LGETHPPRPPLPDPLGPPDPYGKEQHEGR